MASKGEGERELGCNGGFADAAFAGEDLGSLEAAGRVQVEGGRGETHEDDILDILEGHRWAGKAGWLRVYNMVLGE